MGERERLLEAMLSNTEDSPYTVEKTGDGFRLRLDPADARWWAPLQRSGLKKALIHDVHVDEAKKTITITDSMRGFEWTGGSSLEDGLHPEFTANAETSMGRIYSRGVQRSWAFDDLGRFGKVVDYSFDTAEGRDLVRGTARALGWQERMPLTAKIGLVFGVIGSVGAVITIVVLIAMALLGAF